MIHYMELIPGHSSEIRTTMKYGNYQLCATCPVAELCTHYDFPDPAMRCIEEAEEKL